MEPLRRKLSVTELFDRCEEIARRGEKKKMAEEGQVISCHTVEAWNEQLQKGNNCNKLVFLLASTCYISLLYYQRFFKNSFSCKFFWILIIFLVDRIFSVSWFRVSFFVMIVYVTVMWIAFKSACVDLKNVCISDDYIYIVFLWISFLSESHLVIVLF